MRMVATEWREHTGLPKRPAVPYENRDLRQLLERAFTLFESNPSEALRQGSLADRAKALSDADKIDAAIDVVMVELDTLLRMQLFEKAETVLEEVVAERLAAEVKVAALLITGPAREKLGRRAGTIESVAAELRTLFGADQAERTLRPLR